MQRQLKRQLVVPSLIGLTLLVWMPGLHVKADNDDRVSIVGAWILSATLAPGFIDTELFAFNPGGTSTATSSVFNAHSSQDPFLPPFLANPSTHDSFIHYTTPVLAGARGDRPCNDK